MKLIECLTDSITWYSVEEDLPFTVTPVLFWNRGTVDHKQGCYVGWYSEKAYDGEKGRWFDIYGNSIYDGVTHWCPLPKGPDCTLAIGITINDTYLHPDQ